MEAIEIHTVIEIGHEFGYMLSEAFPGHTAVRLVFRRDDREAARARARWSVGYYRAHGTWARPRPILPLPGHMGPRITPMEAAKAQFTLAFQRNKVWAIRIAVIVAVFLGVISWGVREHTVVLIFLIVVGVPLVGSAALGPYLTEKEQRKSRRTIEIYELQQAVERGLIPPPHSSKGD
jgi:hypothetical protein